MQTILFPQSIQIIVYTLNPISQLCYDTDKRRHPVPLRKFNSDCI